jgi:hypothetical protein
MPTNGRCATVPRFYFDLYRWDVAKDPEGLDLPDLESARREAIREARSLITESLQRGHLPREYRVEVRDERGRTVLAVPFFEAIEVEP